MSFFQRLLASLVVTVISGMTIHSAVAAELKCVATVPLQKMHDELQERVAVAATAGFKMQVPRLLKRKVAPEEKTVCRSASLTGSIASEDAPHLEDFLRSNPYLQRIYLYDLAGDPEVAMAMGYALRQQRVGATAPLSADGDARHAVLMRHDIREMTNICGQGAPCVCTDACALVWAGGAVRRGNVVSLSAVTSGSIKRYLTEMDFATPGLDFTRNDGRAIYANFGRTRYPRPIFDDVLKGCGDEPRASALDPSQLAAPGVVKPAYRVELEHMYQGWRACTDVVTFREPL